MKLADQSLEQVIAHEIAHLHYWRHGKKHTELTRYICRLIEKGEPHSMGDNTTPAVSETGTVLMAAMQPTRAISAKSVSNRHSETSPGNQKVGCKQELYEQPE